MKTSKSPLISFRDITKSYKTGDTTYDALKGITFSISKGELLTIMGPSGSGKSTTMHIMGALDVPTSGEYFLNGVNIASLTDDRLAEIRNKEIGFVFQAFNLIPRMTVIKNIERPMMYSNSFSDDQRHKRAMEMLELVQLEGKAENLSNQISGGQIQRVAIARALVMNPSIILADEPTGNLDSKASEKIMQLLQTLNRQGHTIVVITHDPEVAAYTDRIIYIKDGCIVSDKKD